MMIGIRFAEAVPYLLSRVPEISPTYEKGLQFFCAERPGTECVFGSILPQYLVEIYGQRIHPKAAEVRDTIRRSFLVIEDLANSKDEQARLLVEVSFLEHILGLDDGPEKFARFMGRSTRILLRQVAARWQLSIDEFL